MSRRRAPLLALVAVTAIWGYTFVPVQEAIAVYPLFAFLAVRFAISTATLAPFALGPLRMLPRPALCVLALPLRLLARLLSLLELKLLRPHSARARQFLEHRPLPARTVLRVGRRGQERYCHRSGEQGVHRSHGFSSGRILTAGASVP